MTVGMLAYMSAWAYLTPYLDPPPRLIEDVWDTVAGLRDIELAVGEVLGEEEVPGVGDRE